MTYPHPMDDTTGFEATDAEMGLVTHIESIIIAECDCCGAEAALTRCWLGEMETFACEGCQS
jgi:hypothetical protein